MTQYWMKIGRRKDGLAFRPGADAGERLAEKRVRGVELGPARPLEAPDDRAVGDRVVERGDDPRRARPPRGCARRRPTPSTYASSSADRTAVVVAPIAASEGRSAGGRRTRPSSRSRPALPSSRAALPGCAGRRGRGSAGGRRRRDGGRPRFSAGARRLELRRLLLGVSRATATGSAKSGSSCGLEHSETAVETAGREQIVDRTGHTAALQPREAAEAARSGSRVTRAPADQASNSANRSQPCSASTASGAGT